MLIQSGHFERVLVVAAEASIHSLFLASFARLGVLPPHGVGSAVRPFPGRLLDERKPAAVLLENRETAGKITVEQFSIGADANHLTGIDPQALALRRVLTSVLADAPTRLFHAHGTGTQMNDALELVAWINWLPAAPVPIVYSHKGGLYASLGAADWSLWCLTSWHIAPAMSRPTCEQPIR